jgi:hypothetical protein
VIETGKLRSEAKAEIQTLLNRFDLARGDGRRSRSRAGRAGRDACATSRSASSA